MLVKVNYTNECIKDNERCRWGWREDAGEDEDLDDGKQHYIRKW